MRMFKGRPFKNVGSETYRDGIELPTFSEGFLYDTVGKEEARFILGVAAEYEHIIQALGPAAVQRILDVRPRLARRLGIDKAVADCLEDANSRDLEQQLARNPDVTLDNESADVVWKMLHLQYRQHFDPEVSMDRDQLTLYDKLSDELGPYKREQRQKEIDRLPEKLEKKAAREKELADKKNARKNALDKDLAGYRPEEYDVAKLAWLDGWTARGRIKK